MHSERQLPVKTVSVALATPIQDHHGMLYEIVLREPRYEDYMALGDPVTIAETREGGFFVVENPDAIRQYLERCIVKPRDILLVESQVDLRTARKMKDAILGFFRAGAAETEGSTTSSTNSPSEASATSKSAPSAE